MVEYKCFRCGYIGKQKTHLMNHLKRKKPCLPLFNEISIKDVKKYYGFEQQATTGLQQATTVFGHENEPYEQQATTGFAAGCSRQKPAAKLVTSDIKCEFCGKSFTRKYGLTNHLNICKKKEKDEKKMKDIEKEIEELKKKLENSSSNNITNNNYNTTNNNNSTNMTVININNYGEENIKYITKDYILGLLEKPYQAIPELIKYTHFNKDHPENHNIKITNRKAPFVKVLKNNKWELVDKKDTIADLIDQKHSQLNNVDIINNVQPNIYNRIELFNNKYMNNNKEFVSKLYKDSELILLNNS